MSVLQTVQSLQFSDCEAAERLLRRFIEDVFSFEVADVALRPLAVSLNSFNGFLTLRDGRRLFFKSHVEPGSVIAEYYNSDLLQQAGYPVIMPVAASTEPGKQMLLYEVVEDQSVFDVAWDIERGSCSTGTLDRVRAAQHQSDIDLLDAYRRTLEWLPADRHAAAPIHQLFSHRLTGGRLDDFYGEDRPLQLPGNAAMSMGEVRRANWQINGISYRITLDDIIENAIQVLNPAQAGPAVVGHGDAHNGNVFLRSDSMVYFDPAFAGHHDPLLDLVKPLYHNVHAMWMYFPDVLEGERGATLDIQDNTFVVTYPAPLHSVRDMFHNSKTQHTLIPLLRMLRERDWLRSDWRAYLQAGLACCPLLTMDLANSERFPPAIALLGLAHVVEMGANSEGKSQVEMWLDDVEAAL